MCSEAVHCIPRVNVGCFVIAVIRDLLSWRSVPLLSGGWSFMFGGFSVFVFVYIYCFVESPA